MVRRFFLFLAVVCLVGSLIFLPKQPSLRVHGVTVFAAAQAELPADTVWTPHGTGMVIETTTERLPEILALVEVSGVTFSTSNRVSEIVSILHGKIEKTERLPLANIETYYLSLPSMEHYIEMNGKKIGAQIAVTSNGVLVGFPLLLGSY